jgi:hypothetical protein
MAIVKKFTIGIQPLAKMFRITALGGSIVDAVLKLRTKNLSDDFFDEVYVDAERKIFRITSSGASNVLILREDGITFTKDYYNESGSNFDYSKLLNEFKIIWATINKVTAVYDIRRIGIAGEYRYNIDGDSPSKWLREKLINTSPSANRLTEKFLLNFEERKIIDNGTGPDINKADFINTIYSYYDSANDSQHSEPGFVNTMLDIQRYFSPVLNDSVGDEVQKLYKHYLQAERVLDSQLKSFGATNGKK